MQKYQKDKCNKEMFGQDLVYKNRDKIINAKKRNKNKRYIKNVG